MANAPIPKKRFTRFSAAARWLSPTSLASEFAPVTRIPLPTPSRNNRNATLRKLLARGSAKSAIDIRRSPRTIPTFLPSLWSRGPAASEARINPKACVKAMVPFCRGVKCRRAERSGKIVPSMAAIIPYNRMATLEATISKAFLSVVIQTVVSGEGTSIQRRVRLLSRTAFKMQSCLRPSVNCGYSHVLMESAIDA